MQRELTVLRMTIKSKIKLRVEKDLMVAMTLSLARK
jgi:hypothetical protein